MVKESAVLERLFERFVAEKMKNRKRFDLVELEEFLQNKMGGVRSYEAGGGYHGLHRLLQQKKKLGELVPIKSSPFNNRLPPLHSRWQLVDKEYQGWPRELVFKLSRYLDLNYFLQRPRLQTPELADKLINIKKFLQEKEQRLSASREERSLELFADEKFLATSEGKKLLSRLKLSLADLKAVKYGQMFVYWQQKNEIRDILILENHSAFMCCKLAREKGYSLFGYDPDTLIFGNGNQIIKSLKFLREITELNKIRLKYAGDLDPAGMFIYVCLKEKYPEFKLQLFASYYHQLLLAGRSYPRRKKQNEDVNVRQKFIEELCRVTEEEKQKEYYQKRIRKLWENEMRIPQEIITFERLRENNLSPSS
ncbi:MAG: Wadjet anti-phage system protein JetD domain-containing protein [Bacillota bacterium]